MTYGKSVRDRKVVRVDEVVIKGDRLRYAREDLEKIRLLIDEGARDEALRALDKFASVNFSYLI